MRPVFYVLCALMVLTVAGAAVADAPPSRYTYPAPGVVYDTRTKLTWQREVPMSYSPVCTALYRDTGAAGDGCTWEEAKKYCSGLSLAGMMGWRLPTRVELLTLADRSRYAPAIDPTAFPKTPLADFWSSTINVDGSGQVWYVDFIEGYSSFYPPTPGYRVRCVR